MALENTSIAGRVQQASGSTTSATEPVAMTQTAYMLCNLPDRRLRFDFLDLSYKGGVDYKYGMDMKGFPVLIEHEAELGTAQVDGGLLYSQMAASATGARSKEQIKRERYFRRQRVANYENHYQPVIDKIAAYLLRNAPKRDEKKSPEFTRIDIGTWMFLVALDALKYTEGWIGFDTVYLPQIDEEGDDIAYTAGEVEEIDPKNKGEKYIVMCDPRRIVDFDQDDDGTVTRVVIEEVTRIKGSFTKEEKTRTRYKEWTANDWTLYKLTSEETPMTVEGEIEVELDEGPITHAFGVCPWYRLNPSFPSEDIAEANRALFNMSSLLDEELYKNTFTQQYITGAKVEDVNKTMMKGSGNTIVIEPTGAQIGVFGAVVGQAQSLLDKCNDLRDQIYRFVSMQDQKTKNVAEAAEKKKRDLEALYTLLVRLVKPIETLENNLLDGMGIIDKVNNDSLTTYDRKFDVSSVEELYDQLIAQSKVPFSPPSFKRRLTLMLLNKLDPYGDQQKYKDEIDQMIDTSPDVVDAVAQLALAGIGVAEIYNTLLGVPEKLKARVQEALDQHAASANPFGDPHAQPTQSFTEETSASPGTPKPKPAGKFKPKLPKPKRNIGTKQPAGSA